MPTLVRRATAIIVVAALLCATPMQTSAQQPGNPSQEFADPVLAALIVTIVFLGLATGGAAGPLVAVMGHAIQQLVQSNLWIARLDVEQAFMSAWTTQSLVQLDHDVRGATHYATVMQEKLEADAVSLRARARSNFGERMSADAAALDEARLEAVERILPELRKLRVQGQALETKFDTLRRTIIAGSGVVEEKQQQRTQKDDKEPPAPLVRSYFTPQMLQENWSVAADLVAFARRAAEVEQLLFTPITVPVSINGTGQQRSVKPTSETHVRLMFSNDSRDLIFFVRVVGKRKILIAEGNNVREVEVDATVGPAGASLRESWMPLYPVGASARLAKPQTPAQQVEIGAGLPEQPVAQSVVEMTLPSSAWLPMQFGDRLEVRVATYGDYRHHIRWLSLRGKQVRPDLGTLRRGFYYMGYEVGNFLKRQYGCRFSTKEDYTWTLKGAWEKARAESTKNPTQLREATCPDPAAATFALENDLVRWDLPKNLLEARAAPEMSADVNGTAHFVFGTKTLDSVPVKPETGAGTLRIQMQVW